MITLTTDLTIQPDTQEKLVKQVYLLELEDKHFLKVIDIINKEFGADPIKREKLINAVKELSEIKGQRIATQL